MPGWVEIEDCLAQTGREGFAPAFLQATSGVGAVQVMVFAHDAAGATCLLSHNGAEGRLGHRLAADYLRLGFSADPLRARLLALPEGGLDLAALAEIAPQMPAAYRDRFFAAPGLADKVAVLVAGARLRLLVNLYRHQGGQGWDEGALRVLGRLALLHFEARLDGTHATPEPLLTLSERERAVCLGMLDGQKTETIAHAIGVAPSSVTTYRKRAYAKLGVTNRAGLFALCRRG